MSVTETVQDVIYLTNDCVCNRDGSAPATCKESSPIVSNMSNWPLSTCRGKDRLPVHPALPPGATDPRWVLSRQCDGPQR